jgi:site-specific DNA recombinase
LYARVSSDRQAKQATIDSQLAALRDRARADGHPITASDEYVDEGISGSNLVRPALERLRDASADGRLNRLYVHSPDRLARKYAYQVLLLEELAQAGVEVVFIHGGERRTPEGELLVQVQGMIAEYERAHIAERTRRGRLHKARAGSVNVLTAAPYGYEYVRKTEHGSAEYRVLLHQARVVREIFRWMVEDHAPIREICRRLSAEQIPTQTGLPRWRNNTVLQMLRNPAYVGRAAFGRREVVTRTRTRPARGASAIPRKEKTSVRTRPASEHIIIPVPPIVTEEMFAGAQDQLQRNQAFAARNARGERYLLQGLIECATCGYACSGSSSVVTKNGVKTEVVYYHCIMRQTPRGAEVPMCRNPWVRGDDIEGYVWTSVRRVLEEPGRLIEEWTHRNAADGTAAALRSQYEMAGRAVATEERAARRLVDAYEAGVIELDDLRQRNDRVRGRLVRAQEARARATAELHQSIELSGIESSWQAFGEKVGAGLEEASWKQRRHIIRTLVSRVTVDATVATVVYRIPGTPGPSGAASGEDPADSEGRTSRLRPHAAAAGNRVRRRPRGLRAHLRDRRGRGGPHRGRGLHRTRGRERG